MSTSGLLKQKKTSPTPEPGGTGWFSVTPTPKKDKPEETWNRIKNEGKDYGGTLYKILKSDQLDGEDSHGNISFSLLIEPAPQDDAAGGVGEARASSKGSSPVAASDERGDKIDRAVAFKAAVSFLCRRDVDTPANPVAVAVLTDALLDVLTGSAEGKSEERLDDGVPF